MGAYLSAPVTEKNIDVGEGGNGYQYVAGGMQGWRRTMEDAYIVSKHVDPNDPQALMVGVFDGHGGAEVAHFCAQHMGTELVQQDNYKRNEIRDALQEVFLRMDQMLLDDRFSKELEDLKLNDGKDEKGPKSSGANQNVAEKDGTNSLDLLRWLKTRMSASGDSDSSNNIEGESGIRNSGSDSTVQSGCTAVVGLIKKGELYVANAGDSRAVLSRGGQSIQLSDDHKPALDSERNRIIAAGGFLSEMAGVTRVNGNLNLSRAIGDLKYKTNEKLEPKDQIITALPDVECVKLSDEDEFLILACDGVWDVMSNDDVVNFVRTRLQQSRNLQDIISELLDNCLAADPKEARGVGCDNITVVILILKQLGDS
eukprot:TRINITY_DN6586_c0_g2_i8.p1 TRINITY_DN6586_c0_g2~~TRINITY_DN6586_c0_g2_i8.p1  ORF type:complete len:369 (-),score=50.28 TRINITY_DN6586_c0_g2_i8:571-1677(-)